MHLPTTLDALLAVAGLDLARLAGAAAILQLEH